MLTLKKHTLLLIFNDGCSTQSFFLKINNANSNFVPSSVQFINSLKTILNIRYMMTNITLQCT